MKSMFDSQKKDMLRKFNKALARNEVDEAIIPLVKFINSLDDYYTTSSCSGRISLFHDLGSKKDSKPLSKWHREIEFEEISDPIGEIINLIDENGINIKQGGIIWFKYEPMIIHLVARSLEQAIVVLNLALKSGFKRSGIQVLKPGRYMVEICSTERIDTPIINNKKQLVSNEYLKYLVGLANKKFQTGILKLERFERELELAKDMC